MKTKAQAVELVRAAFVQAQQKYGPQTNAMTLAVLNNRLLQITDRRFQPRDFGANDLKAFIALLAPEFRLTGEPPKVSVELVAPAGHVPAKARVTTSSPRWGRHSLQQPLRSPWLVASGRISGCPSSTTRADRRTCGTPAWVMRVPLSRAIRNLVCRR